MENEFKHLQSAHCENGVTTNLLKTIGVNKLTEPLTFGIGAGSVWKFRNSDQVSLSEIPDPGALEFEAAFAAANL